jgi:hypothetical protein
VQPLGMTMNLLLTAHLAVTWALVGLIWMIQVVHYPLMARVGEADSRRYQTEHIDRIGRLVAPLMICEALLTGYLCLMSDTLHTPWLAWLGAALLAIVWTVTGIWSVPAHTKLTSDNPSGALKVLVATNWMRTFAWSGRGLIAVALVASTQLT